MTNFFMVGYSKLAIFAFSLLIVGCGGGSSSPPPQNVDSNTLYIADGQSTPGNLYTVNPADGTATTVGPIMLDGNNVCVTALAILNDVLYGVTCDFNGGGTAASNSLVTIDPATGNATSVGAAVDAMGDEAVIADMASANGVLYGWNDEGNVANTDSLHTFDTATGELAVVADQGICGAGSGLAFTDTGDLYFMGCEDFHLMDPSDGSSINEISAGDGDSIDMTWCDGAMWAVSTGQSNITANAAVGTVDLTTGVFTSVYDASGTLLTPDAIACRS